MRVTGSDGHVRIDDLRCPRCGRALAISLLEVAADDGDEPEALVLLDCPSGDFHGTVTRNVALEFITAEVVRRLR